MNTHSEQLKLYGFNNLTKSLSFNLYDICYTTTDTQRRKYLEYIDESYNAERLTHILTQVTRLIGANVLNIARQDYEPRGASVTMLIADGYQPDRDRHANKSAESTPSAILAHLDKSHITVHTYPESHPDGGINTFRADIDVSTCGHISPLEALDFLIESFESDIVIIDYRIRGFTRCVEGTKYFNDHSINSIQNFLSDDTKSHYHIIDVNVYQENIFHTKMMLNDFSPENYLFGVYTTALTPHDRRKIRSKLRKEMREIFNGRNMASITK